MRIIRALGTQAWDGRDRSPDAVRPVNMARRFGVRDELLRERIARLEHDGVISGYEIYPNFRHLGLDATTFHYRLPDDGSKAAAVDEAAAFDGVFGVYGYLDPHVCVDICYRSPADRARRLDVLGKLMGNARPLVLWQRHLPTVERALDRLDWRIIQGLRGAAKRPLEDVAQSLGTSVRTVRRRYSRLANEGSIDVVPNVDPTRIAGTLLLEFHIHFDGTSSVPARKVLEILDEHWFSAWTPPDSEIAGQVVVLCGESVARFEELRQAVQALAAVRSVRVLVPSRVAFDGSWIDDAIEERIGALST